MARERKGFTILGEEGVKVIMVIVISLVLIYLGIKIFGLYATTSAIEKAKSELVGIETGLNEAAVQKAEKEYIILQTPEWYLSNHSGESGLCSGLFCLCLCELEDCSGDNKACVPTSKQMLIEENGNSVESILIKDKPRSAMLKITNDVYVIDIKA